MCVVYINISMYSYYILLSHPQTYEDLDEILARFVQPMASYAKDLLIHKSYRKAKGGNFEELKKLLREEKSKNPKRIPYFFSAYKELPGKFCLGYQPGSKPRVEYVTVTPDGFRYRNHVHESVDGLIFWFKEHHADLVPTAHGTPTSVPTPSSSSSHGYPGQGTQATGGGGGQFGWNSGHTQTPGQTPVYTPSQTPHSIQSLYVTPIPTAGRPPLSRWDGHAQQVGMAMSKRHNMEPPGTPVLDE